MNNINELLANAWKLQHEGNLNQAIDLYAQILKQNPQHSEACHLQALAHAQLGDLDTAILFFKQALQQLPDDPVLHNNLANAYKQSHQQNPAILHYKRAIELLPTYAQAHNNLAGIMAQNGSYQEALHHYIKAVHAEPDFAAAHFNLGLLLIKNNQLEAAQTQFKNVLALNPEHVESQFYLGVFDLEAGQLQQAEQAFHNVLLHENNHVQALTNLGVVALKKHENQLAIDYFSKALTIDNEHHEARNNLAATFMHHDRFENALMHYDVLLHKEPDNIEYLYNSGVAQMALGHLNEAIQHFEHLLYKQDNHFAALNNLAAIYIRMDDRIKARDLLQRAITANPEDKTSQHMLRALTGSNDTAETCPDYAENLFNNYALYYDQHVQKYLHYTLPNQIVRVLDEQHIKWVEHTLDIGCGTGLSGQVLRDISQTLDGIDIAEKMLAEARAKNIYDTLVQTEALHFLKQTQTFYGLIVAADVLPYFGDLDALFQAISERLIQDGHFIFTSEISSTASWQLQHSARFSHHPDYLQQLANKYGLQNRFQQEVVARQQEGRDLSVVLMALQKTAGGKI